VNGVVMFTVCGTDMIRKLAVRDALPQIQTYIFEWFGRGCVASWLSRLHSLCAIS